MYSTDTVYIYVLANGHESCQYVLNFKYSCVQTAYIATSLLENVTSLALTVPLRWMSETHSLEDFGCLGIDVVQLFVTNLLKMLT